MLVVWFEDLIQSALLTNLSCWFFVNIILRYNYDTVYGAELALSLLSTFEILKINGRIPFIRDEVIAT